MGGVKHVGTRSRALGVGPGGGGDGGLGAALADAASEGIWAIDERGQTAYANPAMAELLGCREGELAAADPWSFVPAAGEAAARRVLFGEPRQTEQVLRRADGTPLPCRIASRRLATDDGRLLDVAFVTDRRAECLLEAEHRVHQSRLASALSVARLFAWQWKTGTEEVVLTPNTRDILGLQPDARLDMATVTAMVHPDDRALYDQRLSGWPAADDGDTAELEYRMVRPDGAVRRFHALCRAQRGPGGELFVVGTTHDVTEQRRLEEQLLRARKLEGIGRLAGGVAHDFNNLITAILTSATLIESGLGPGGTLGEHAAEDLGVIRAAATRAARLTQQLQRFAAQPRVERVDLDLTDVVVDLEGMLRRLAGEHCALVLDLEPALWTVLGDGGALGEVLIQLVANAAESLHGAGSVTVTTANRVLGEADGVPPGEYVELAVADGGAGQAEDARRDLFEPLGGGGDLRLGLASCYGIVERHGGHLTVASQPGVGTAVALRLPRGQADRDAALARSTTTTCETVLLVEDEELVRRMMVRGLAELGYDILVAADAEEALELVASHDGPLDVAIADVVLPGLGGVAFADRLHETHPGLPVIFVSGHLSDVVARHGAAAQAHFLTKPYSVEQLVAKIRDALA